MEQRWPRVKAWLPPGIWAAVLFGLSSIPGSSFPTVSISSADKMVHVTVYGILGGLCYRALRRTTTWSRTGLLLSAIVLAGVYGVSDEIHQLFVPRRSFDVRDMLADVTGAAVGALVAMMLGARRRQRSAT